jgi:hypothetical protein
MNLPRRGWISKPRVAQRTLGFKIVGHSYPEGVQSTASFPTDETPSGYLNRWTDLPRVRCATLGFAIQPLRGKCKQRRSYFWNSEI